MNWIRCTPLNDNVTPRRGVVPPGDDVPRSSKYPGKSRAYDVTSNYHAIRYYRGTGEIEIL